MLTLIGFCASIVALRLRSNLFQQWTVMLKRDEVQRGAAGADAMCITVGGDTFQGIVMMMSRMPVQRPLSLDLLWQARACANTLLNQAYCLQSWPRGPLHARALNGNLL